MIYVTLITVKFGNSSVLITKVYNRIPCDLSNNFVCVTGFGSTKQKTRNHKASLSVIRNKYII